jgi:hypothetical protein
MNLKAELHEDESLRGIVHMGILFDHPNRIPLRQ